MPDTSPRIFQYSLRALLGVPVIVALILPPLLMQDRWTLLLSLALGSLGWFAIYYPWGMRTQRLGTVAGACAGYWSVAIYGTGLPVRVFHERAFFDFIVPSTVAFGIAGLVVTLFSHDITSKCRYVSHWLTVGFIAGPMIGWISVLIASSDPDRFLPIVNGSRLLPACLFASFTGATLGGFLGSDSVAPKETEGET